MSAQDSPILIVREGPTRVLVPSSQLVDDQKAWKLSMLTSSQIVSGAGANMLPSSISESVELR